MALINCSECGKEISDKAVACPNCGCPLPRANPKPRSSGGFPKKNNNKKRSQRLYAIFFFLIVLPIMLFVLSGLSDNQSSEGKKPLPKVELKKKLNDSFDDQIESKYRAIINYNDEGNFKDAIFVLDQFQNFDRLDYKDIAELNVTIRVQQYIDIIKTTDSEDVETLYDCYLALTKLEPDNPEFQAKYKKYKGERNYLQYLRKEASKPKSPAPSVITKPSSSWYSGGTLHNATMREWSKASYSDRLATSSDFLIKLMQIDGHTIPPVNELRPTAIRLEQEISNANLGGVADNQAAASVAATVWILMK